MRDVVAERGTSSKIQLEKLLSVLETWGFSAISEAMPKKLKRYYGRGHLHFITFSCHRRMALLGTARARNLFVASYSGRSTALMGIDFA